MTAKIDCKNGGTRHGGHVEMKRVRRLSMNAFVGTRHPCVG